MSSVAGVSSLYQAAPTDKPPLKAAALASAVLPSSCLRPRRSVSRGWALVVSSIAVPSSALSEAAFKGVGGSSFTDSPLVNKLEEEEDGGELDENDQEVEEEYGPEGSEGGGNDELATANLGLAQRLAGSLKKRGITQLFPIQVQPRVVKRPWYLSSSAGTLIAAAHSMQLVPPEALAQSCDATFTQTAFIAGGANTIGHHSQRLVLMDLDPTTAKLAISIVGLLLSAYGFLFILRIVMSWYPKLPVSKFPFVVAYAPTEPLLILTRKLIPPLGGVDVTPVVWFGLISFLNEILVGPQGLLVLLSQQV